MHRSGYNIYVMGESGTGRTSYVRHYLEGRAQEMRTPEDWAYVNNFDNPREPSVLRLPAGTGSCLLDDFNTLIDEANGYLPRRL